MSRPQSPATDRALALIGKRGPDGRIITPYAAARIEGIGANTIYRALKRLREAKKRK